MQNDLTLVQEKLAEANRCDTEKTEEARCYAQMCHALERLVLTLQAKRVSVETSEKGTNTQSCDGTGYCWTTALDARRDYYSGHWMSCDSQEDYPSWNDAVEKWTIQDFERWDKTHKCSTKRGQFM